MFRLIIFLLILAFMLYTDELIAELVGCPKKVTTAPKDSGVGRGSSKIKFALESIDGNYSFSGFISKNLTFQENFQLVWSFNQKMKKVQ
jgi:hypothetical protein